MVMLIAAEVNRGMRAARLALQKGEQTLLHGRAEMSEAELWNIYTQLSNENERKLDTSVERVLKEKGTANSLFLSFAITSNLPTKTKCNYPHCYVASNTRYFQRDVMSVNRCSKPARGAIT